MTNEKHYLLSELEDLLQNDLKMWRFLQESSLDGIWYWDLENPDQEWMSPEFWSTLGVDPSTKEHLASEWQDLIFADDKDLALQNFIAHCEDPNHPYDQIVRYVHSDGSTVWVRCRGMAIRDDNGRAIRMLGAHTDLTASKRAELVALKQQDVANAAMKELQSFAYSVSHDLKSPSNTMKYLLDELKETQSAKLDIDGQHLLKLASNTVDRMTVLIDDVLRYTQILSKDIIEKTSVDLNEVVRAVVEDLRAGVHEAEADFEIAPLPVVQGDPTQLRVLFQNLIENGLKFKHPDLPARIALNAALDRDSGTHLISVRDNGIGMPKQHQERIFEVFQRLHRAEDVPGTGLGLAMCRRILRNHGGDIAVESSDGHGAVFTCSLQA